MRARHFITKKPTAMTENQDLFEIKMSPSNLSKLAKSINAQAGIEFEMIIPDITSDDGESELEADYDMDERITSIDDVIDFFNDGDYNSSRDIRNLREELNAEFYEWLDEQIMDKWNEEGRDYLRDYIHNNDLYDGSEEDLELQTETSWEEQDSNYESAQEEFREAYQDILDDGDWLNSAGYTYATDIERNFDVQWPHYTIGGDAEVDIKSVAEEFEQMIGRPVEWSTSYHGAQRKPGAYAVEPDGSLEGDNSGDSGLEFISPPLPLDELLSDMQKIRAWAKQRGAYTNDSTGLHMNISVPNTSTAKLDYIKLALLLGDEHVLKEFGREANTYTGSALKKIRDIIKDDPSKADQVLKQMQGQMAALATKVVHSGETQKFTSINTKGNYVEFRSPGGDYLDANWDKVVPTLLRSVVALDAAMDPQKYREEYQKKLFKLLDGSKEQQAGTNVNKLLSMYFTSDQEGGSKDVARQLARELIVQRQAASSAGKDGRDYVWRITMPVGTRLEVVAQTKEEAKEIAAEKWRFSAPDLARAKVEALRPAEPQSREGSGRWGLWITGLNKFAVQRGERMEFASRQEASEWYQDRVLTSPGTRSDIEVLEIPATQARELTNKPKDGPTSGNTAEGNLRWYIRNMETGEILHRYYARDYHEAATELAWWKEQNPGLDLKYGRDEDEPGQTQTQTQVPSGQTQSGDWAAWSNARERFATIGNSGTRRFNSRADTEAWIRDYNIRFPEQDLGLVARKFTSPAAAPAQSATGNLGSFSGEWKIVDANGREIHRFSGVGNVQADANRVALAWLRQNPGNMRDGVEVVPVMER